MRTNKTQKNIRNILIFICIACLLFAGFFVVLKPVVTAQAQTNLLSEMSDNDCIEFIIENEIDIPAGYINKPNFGGFVKSIIQAVEIQPDYTFGFNSTALNQFAENIKGSVNDYYGS